MTERVYGIHVVEALLQHQPNAVRSLFCQQERSDARLNNLAEQAKSLGVSVQQVPRKTLDKMEKGLHQGVIAECSNLQQYQEADLADLFAAAENPLFLVLDEVTDPHNLGACLRTANAMGAVAVIAPKDHAAKLNAVARKVACGAAEVTPYIVVNNLARCLRDLQQLGVWMVGLSADAEQRLSEIDLKGPIGLIMGSEGKGLRRLTAEHCDYQAKIDMFGTVESLNVSVAAGMVLYEVARQRLALG